ncbi:hypothetical protein CYMTET_25400 [Cymbomonas tetramitiformis]|uniref:PiggyBac transposable element-derived protein domain-containing protein n=1 Tax=Cymbomonas tetramitiformis TaxID=36881 RepID=A0AAE0FUL4_9CHLO|nr:hypothetical protein CYMTET_25400 [Cymbomonas tetramitiformis]
MCCNPGYTRDEYWAERASEVSRIAHNLGEKSKLQRHDFDHILEYFVLPEYVSGVPFTDPLSPSDCGLPEGIPPDDAFRQVRRFIDGLNEQWRTVFTPGTKLTIDESMIKWLSRYLCPGWVKVGRKPDSMGHELKTLVDSTSRILFQFELQEGKEYDNRKKFVAEYGATTKTALLLYEWGIYSVLNVKTAHKLFPKFALLAALKDKGLGCEAPDGRAYRTAMKCATCHMVDERPAWVCAAARSACWDLHVQYAFSHKMAHTPKRVCKHKKAEHNQEELLRIASSKRLQL